MKNIISILLLLAVISSCASATARHEGEIPSDGESVKATYCWLEQSTPSGDLRVDNQDIDRLVRQAVNHHLKMRGYHLTAPDQADYLVTWFGTIDEEVREVALNNYYSTYGYGSLQGKLMEGMDNGKAVKTFLHGTLILDVLDRDDRQLLWRGSATNVLRPKMSESQRAHYIDLSVRKILEGLPQR